MQCFESRSAVVMMTFTPSEPQMPWAASRARMPRRASCPFMPGIMMSSVIRS